MKHAAQNRDLHVDFLKTLAILSVVMLHTCEGGFHQPLSTRNWYAALLWGTVSRAGVPLFLMCSGVLLINPNKVIKLKTFYSKNFMRILVSLLFWALAYKIFDLFTLQHIDFAAIVLRCKDIVMFRHEGHLYYLHIMIIVYAVLPTIRTFAANATRKDIEYALVIWFVFGIVYPTLRQFYPLSNLQGIPAQWAINMTYASSGYCLLGYYLRKYNPFSAKSFRNFTILGGTVILVGTWLMSIHRNELYQGFFEGMSLGVALLSIGIFGCALKNVHQILNTKIIKFITFTSKASFCIYLVHIFFIKILNMNTIIGSSSYGLIVIPALTIINLCLSGLIYAILSKIPLVKKWII